MKYKIMLAILPLAVFLFFSPSSAQAWYDSSYVYRSTVIGTAVKDTGNHVYEIVNAKNNFSKHEPVYVLTRIFNITKVDKFQFQFKLLNKNGQVIKDLYSPLYQPRGNWWAETYAWHNFGPLNAGEYRVEVAINLNHSGYKHLDTKYLRVDDGYKAPDYGYQDKYKKPGYYQPVYKPAADYQHNWTYTGTDVSGYGYYEYNIVNRKSNFEQNQDVVVLTKLGNIKGVESFRVKHELYANGQSLFASQESGTYRPNYQEWTYNYNWHNFGRLPRGEHEIRVYVAANNASYKQIASVIVKVGDSTAINNQAGYYNNEAYAGAYSYQGQQYNNTMSDQSYMGYANSYAWTRSNWAYPQSNWSAYNNY